MTLLESTHGAIKGTPTPSSTDDSTVKDLYAREAQDRLGLSFTPDLNDPKMVSAIQNALNMQAKGTLDSFAQGQLTGTDATVQSATPAPPTTQPDQPPAVTPTQPPAAQPPAPGTQSNVPQTPPTTSFAGTLINAESGGKNIANTTQTTSSGQAQGAFQITTGTWNDFGGKKYADTPLQASVSQQFEIAKGIPLKRWAAPTINALKAAGFKVDLDKTLGENIAMNDGTAPGGAAPGGGAPASGSSPGGGIRAMGVGGIGPGAPPQTTDAPPITVKNPDGTTREVPPGPYNTDPKLSFNVPLGFRSQ